MTVTDVVLRINEGEAYAAFRVWAWDKESAGLIARLHLKANLLRHGLDVV